MGTNMERRSFLSLLMLAALPVGAAEAVTWPLLVSQRLDANGKPAPISELTQTILTYISLKSDVKFELQPYPWKRALLLAQEGVAPIWGISRNLERDKIFIFSHSVYSTNVWMVVRKDRFFPIASIADLKGKHVSVPQGGAFNSEFESARANKLFTVEDDPHSLDIRFAKLIAGRCDVMLVSNRIDTATKLEIYFKSYGFDADQFQIIERPLLIDEIHIAILRSKADTFPMEAINRAIDAGRKAGDFERM